MPERKLPTYAPPPYELRPTLLDRAQRRLRDLAATPRGASLLTIWALAFVALVITAVPVTVEAMDDRGSLTATCGIEAVVFGHPDATAARACREAMTGRAVVFFVAATIVLVGVAVAIRPAVAGRLRTPRQAALAGGVGLSAILLLVSLRSVPVDIAEEHLSVRCGIDTAVLGHPMAAVEDACRDATTPQAWLFVVGLVALVACGAGLLRQRLAARSIVLAAGLAVALAVAVVAARPLTIEVPDTSGASMLVSCGIDTAVVGHGIDAVEDACRDEIGTHGAAFVGAALVVAVAALGLARTGSDWRTT